MKKLFHIASASAMLLAGIVVFVLGNGPAALSSYNPLPPLGQATMANSLPVTIASNQSAVSIVGTRVVLPTPISVSLGSSSYAAGTSVGGKLTIATGLGAGVNVRIEELVILLTGSPNASGLITYGFNTSPSTTFTDGSAVTWNTADNSNLKYAAPLGNFSAAGISGIGTISPGISPFLAGPVFTTDSSGNIYLALVATGTALTVTSGTLQVSPTISY